MTNLFHKFYNPSVVRDIQEGENVIIDKTNPEAPIISVDSAGGGSWGSITGNIEDQTDLIGYLDENIPTPLTAGSNMRIEDGKVVLGATGEEGYAVDTGLRIGTKSVFDPIYARIEMSLSSLMLSAKGYRNFIGNIQLSDYYLNSTIDGFGTSMAKGVMTITPWQGNTAPYAPVIGMQYGGDYSSVGKTLDRWIPDWGAVKDYVDDSLPTFSQGLRVEEGVVKIGTNLAEGNSLDYRGTELMSYDTSASGMVRARGFRVKNQSAVIESYAKDIASGNNYAYSGLTTSDEGSLSIISKSDFVSGSSKQTRIDMFYGLSVGVRITDNDKRVGMGYDADYSTAGKTLDRWIPDWKAVKDLVAESSLTPAQKLAISSLVSPEEDYVSMVEVTSAIKNIIDALQA